MSDHPDIPMTPDDVPQQKLRLVTSLPPRPEMFRGACDFVNPMPVEKRPKGSPRKYEYLGSVEWASGPRHTRFDSYYINARGSYWLLWNRWYEEYEDKWNWVLYGYALKKKVHAKTAAIYLVHDAWVAERDGMDLGRYYLVDRAGLLSVAEISEIAGCVWPGSS